MCGREPLGNSAPYPRDILICGVLALRVLRYDIARLASRLVVKTTDWNNSMQQVAGTANKLFEALDRGQSLPASWYTEPAIAQQEIERIFRKSWQYVGSTHQLAR